MSDKALPSLGCQLRVPVYYTTPSFVPDVRVIKLSYCHKPSVMANVSISLMRPANRYQLQ